MENQRLAAAAAAAALGQKKKKKKKGDAQRLQRFVDQHSQEFFFDTTCFLFFPLSPKQER
jgi:hypothetical protein